MADIKPTRKQQTVATIKQFIIGNDIGDGDFSHAQIEEMIVNLAKWFAAPESGMSYPDPLETARAKVRECLLGVKADGSVWQQAPDDFRKRLKIKANYDYKAKRGVPVKKRTRERNVDKTAKAKATGVRVTKMQPVHATTNVEAESESFTADILSVFPELDNAAHRPTVEALGDVYAQRKVISAELKLGVTASKRDTLLNQMKTIEMMTDSMMSKLGIHPNQVRKKIVDEADSSVADLVAHISDDKEFQKREKQWSLQLALQLWWMSEHNNYVQDGPNVSDWEIWSLTRSRPIRHKCKCSYECVLVEGFEPHELRDMLLHEGVLIEQPVMGNFMTAEDLAGLATFTTVT
jgi:hypothetical protein